MSVKEYSFKFIKLSTYSSSFVSNARDEMSHYVTGVFEELNEEFRAAMHHENMYLSRFMVSTQQVEESYLRKRNGESKMAKSF